MTQIRRLKESDITIDFLELLSQFRPTNLTVRQARLIFREHRTLIYGIFIESKLIGITTLILEHKFIRNGGIVGHIEDVIIHNEFRRMDIGSQLIRYVIAEAKRAGAYKLILNTHNSVSDFYERFGFVKYNIGMMLDIC